MTGGIHSIDIERLAPLVREASTEIWSNMFSNRPRALASEPARRVSYEAESTLERAASAELNQWLKYDDWL